MSFEEHWKSSELIANSVICTSQHATSAQFNMILMLKNQAAFSFHENVFAAAGFLRGGVAWLPVLQQPR